MERRNLALLCAGVVCFWLFALADRKSTRLNSSHSH